jgi:hypothetical protein
VTEAEWLAATESMPLLAFPGAKASDRKRRLFACACCRRFWVLVSDPVWRRAVEMAERYADGSESLAALRAVELRDYRNEARYNPLWSTWPAVANALRPVGSALGAVRAAAIAAHNHALREPTGARAAFERVKSVRHKPSSSAIYWVILSAPPRRSTLRGSPGGTGSWRSSTGPPTRSVDFRTAR